MSDQPLADSMQASSHETSFVAEREVAFLFKALECEDPRAGAARHSLEGVERVDLERGERGFFQHCSRIRRQARKPWGRR
jgi:hypothetical protein